MIRDKNIQLIYVEIIIIISIIIIIIIFDNLFIVDRDYKYHILIFEY